MRADERFEPVEAVLIAQAEAVLGDCRSAIAITVRGRVIHRLFGRFALDLGNDRPPCLLGAQVQQSNSPRFSLHPGERRIPNLVDFAKLIASEFARLRHVNVFRAAARAG
jgi:hypothetical protein